MPVPAHKTANLAMIKSETFTGLQIFFDGPTSAVDLGQSGQGGVGGSPDQDEGQCGGIIEAAAHEQPVAIIVGASLQQGQTSPIEKLLALRARTGREPVPIARTQSLLSDGGDIPKQRPVTRLDTDDLGGRDRQSKGVVLVLEPLAQLRAVAVDGVTNDPLKGQTRLLSTAEHVDGQFGFGLEGEGIGNVSSTAAWQVSAPLLGQVQLAVDEGMAALGDVGEEDANLAVLDGAAGTAILLSDTSGVVATFGTPALIGSENGENQRGGC